MERLEKYFRWYFPSARERCLKAQIPSFKLQLDNAIKTRGEGLWSESAKAALAQASEALLQHNFDEALIAFDLALREEIPSLGKEEVDLRAISLLHQSEQLSTPTRDTIKEILKTPSVSIMQLATATKLRDEDLQTTFFAMQRLNRHLNKLCYITGGVLLGVVLLTIFHILCDLRTVLGVMCFGALGAAASTMMSIMPPTDGPVPSQLKTGTLLFARPLFGATAALAVYVFLRMGVLNVPPAYNNEFANFGFAFAAGFSDRLLLSAVSKVAASSTKSAKGKESKAE
jgi:hypothetical protein